MWSGHLGRHKIRGSDRKFMYKRIANAQCSSVWNPPVAGDVIANVILCTREKPGIIWPEAYFRSPRRNIILIEINAKCRYLKNVPVKGLCGRCLSVRLFGVVKQFWRFWMWSEKELNSWRILSPTQLKDHSPSQPHKSVYNVHVYCTLTLGRGEGWGRWTRAMVREAIVHKAGSKYQHDWMYLLSIKLLNTSKDDI